MVDLDAMVPGMLAEDDGAVALSGADGAPAGASVTDGIARRTLAMGGHVVAAAPGDILGGGPLAAILSYPLR